LGEFNLSILKRKDAAAQTILFYTAAVIAEIAGCFAFWARLRLEKPAWWLISGILSRIYFS
jgi:small multidrug resistance family-3 protein